MCRTYMTVIDDCNDEVSDLFYCVWFKSILPVIFLAAHVLHQCHKHGRPTLYSQCLGSLFGHLKGNGCDSCFVGVLCQVKWVKVTLKI